jgi:iron complex outermembrane receptor protein
MCVPLRAQDATLTGVVTDSLTNAPVEGARVDVIAPERAVTRTVTDVQGVFALSVPAGTYTVVITRLDYRPVRLAGVALGAGATRRLTIRLVPHAYVINPVVVSASRAEEKALDAPASVTVVDERSIAERPAVTPIDHVYGTAGLDVATTGIMAHEVVSRGFNNVSSGALLVLTDGRYAAVPSLRINVFSFIPLTDDDIERIELVRGPGSALYGPNSSNGVLHVLSRSPFESRPATLTLTGGERGMLHGQLRVAQPLGRRVALKLSAQYLRADDWPYADPEEQAARLLALGTGADADTLLIGRRDTTVERVGGEARIDWRPGAETTVTTAVGVNGALRHIELTPLGAAQLDDWRSAYVQTRVRHGRLFGQAFINASGSGDTYLLRTGAPITDQSRMMVAQLQHGSFVGSRVNLTYGLDLQRTEPRTEGTLTGRNEDDDAINEAGGYLHADVQLTPVLRAVAAARVDYHNRLTDLVCILAPGGTRAPATGVPHVPAHLQPRVQHAQHQQPVSRPDRRRPPLSRSDPGAAGGRTQGRLQLSARLRRRALHAVALHAHRARRRYRVSPARRDAVVARAGGYAQGTRHRRVGRSRADQR